MRSMPSPHLKISDQVSWSGEGEELVLLNMATGSYYSLNRLGSTIWRLVSDHKSHTDIVAILHDDYDVDKFTASTEVRQFLDNLARAGLITEEDHP
jgi:hypothetical protein